MKPKFRTPSFRAARFAMYCLLGISAFIPVVHGLVSNGWETMNQQTSLIHFLGLGLLNFTGAVIYAARIPERWFPRVFDIYGSSHQIMHVLVICGALSYMTGLIKALEFWRLSGDSSAGACGLDYPF